jgi:exodeoxyribonuclease VIII
MSEQFYSTAMTSAEYHAHHALGKSSLDMVRNDPHALAWSKLCERDTEKMQALDFGDAMHAILLEPDRLKSEFVAMPEADGRTKEGKAIKEAFYAENSGKKILAADDYKKLVLMFDSVMSHPQARELLEAEGISEGSYFWQDKETGIDLKCRPDREIESLRLLVDVKTTDSLKKFCYSVEDYRYYVQDPFYCDGVAQFKDKPTMLFLVVQKTIDCGRYPVMVKRLPEEAIIEGRKCYRSDLNKYKRFLDAGKPTTDYDELIMHYRFIDHCMEGMEISL